MAEEKSNGGIFWGVLLVVIGGSIWAINKFIINKNTSTDSTPGKTDKQNAATKDGLPFSIDVSKVNMSHNSYIDSNGKWYTVYLYSNLYGLSGSGYHYNYDPITGSFVSKVAFPKSSSGSYGLKGL